MDRVRFIDHEGHRILLLDYSNCTNSAEMLKMIEIRKAIAKAQRPASLLTLTDATGAKFNHDVLKKIKEAAALERPVIKRAAVVGIDTVSKAVIDAVRAFSGRRWANFNTREEALDWLVGAAGRQPSGISAAAGPRSSAGGR
jgi:hypothetical protein